MGSGGKAGGGPSAVASGGAFGGLTGVDAPLTGLGTGGVHLAIPAATSLAAGHMTAAQVQALAAVQTGAGLGWLAETIGRCVSKAGIADEQISPIVYEGGGVNWVSPATQQYEWQEVAAGGGGPSYGSAATDRGGLTRLRRSIGSGTSHYQRCQGGYFEGNSAAGKRWYMRARVQFGSLAGAGAALIMAFGASNNSAHTSFIDVGVVAANSTAKYSARITGTTTVNLISTVNLDTTTTRWVECWCDGTNTFLSVEDETPVSGAYVAFAASLKANLWYCSDGTAGTRDMFLDRAFWGVEQAT